MILVIGDAMIDRYIDGRIRRMAQEAPVPVFEPSGDYRDYPGGAANVASNIEALGEEVVLVKGTCESPTRKTRYVVGGNMVFRIDEEARGAEIRPADIIDAAAKAIGGASAVVISDYARGVVSEEVAAYAVQATREWGIPLIVDPKPPRLMSSWIGCTVIKMNEHEARIANPTASLPLFGRWVLVTKGAAGMTLHGDDDVIDIPATAREVFDVVGAGDTVAAALAVGLSRGWTMEKSARFANAAAGVVVGKHGTATASSADVEAAMTPNTWN